MTAFDTSSAMKRISGRGEGPSLGRLTGTAPGDSGGGGGSAPIGAPLVSRAIALPPRGDWLPVMTGPRSPRP
jgi:hypothetical protein